MKFILVVFFGTGFAGNTSMLKFDTEAECKAAESAIVAEYLPGEEERRLQNRERAKCIPYPYVAQ
ncbi:MAG: hypothetical protein ABJN42_29815 [Roseibium sp.]|uniref:hypothetical protein n=1 Tax=Roseibium sp. TaxID=1936156 RepID=UPI003297CEB5